VADDQVVQDLVYARHASRQAANIEVDAVFQHALQTDTVRDTPNDKCGETELRMGEQVALDGLFQTVRRPGFAVRSFVALVTRPARRLHFSGSKRGQPIHFSIPFLRPPLLLLCAGSSLSVASHECKNSAL
jgi:hypothetical protein